MATMTMRWFGKAPAAMLNKEIDILDDTIKIMFTNSSAVPDQDVWDYKDDVTGEVTGTNLPAGGIALVNDTLTYTAGTNVMKYDADDISQATVTASDIKHGVLYDDTPATPATKPLLGYGVLDVAVSPSAGALSIVWDSLGVLTMSAA